jgi:hypothetical protein
VREDEPRDEPHLDEEPLRDGGFRRFRRLMLGSGSIGTSFSVFEEIFAPTRHQARIEILAQSRAVRPAPRIDRSTRTGATRPQPGRPTPGPGGHSGAPYRPTSGRTDP